MSYGGRLQLPPLPLHANAPAPAEQWQRADDAWDAPPGRSAPLSDDPSRRSVSPASRARRQGSQWRLPRKFALLPGKRLDPAQLVRFLAGTTSRVLVNMP